MSDVDDDQDWLKIEPADEPDDESYEWILIQHDWFQEEEEEEEEEEGGGENSSEEEEEEEEEEEDYEAFIEEEDDDGLFFLAEPEQEGEEERKELLEVIKHQVLPRLPAKSVLRLKSTSRQWNGYISSPLFVHTHSQLRRRSLSGMFFHSPSGAPSFAAFDGDPSPLPDPSLSFLPEPVHVVASAGGLLCCRGRRSAGYYVCNPMLPSEWALLPPPPLGGSHGPDDPAVALVMQEPSAYNFRADYHVVIAHEVLEGVYAFESFSSAAAGGAGWRRSNEIAAAERIVTGSVVSAGGCAYWRTTMQSVVCYNPEADASRAVPGPTAAAWEIGEMGRRLCCVSVEWDVAEVRVLEDVGSEPRWRKVEEFAVEAAAAWEAEEGGAVPLRTQSSAEAVVWEGRSGLVVAHDLSTGGKRVLVQSAAPGYCADFLPYVSSLVHVHRYQ